MKVIILVCFSLLRVQSSVTVDEVKTNPPLKATTNYDDDFEYAMTTFHSKPGLAPVEPPFFGKRCECGVFQGSSVNNEPVITQSPGTVPCTYYGQDLCIQLCSKLVTTVQEYGPRLLCATLGHYNNLVVTVHSRICGSKLWSPTQLISPPELCCHDHEVISCSEIGNNKEYELDF